MHDHFDRNVFPVLTPLAVDTAHPFPYISNLALSIGVFVVDPDSGERKFARVKVPDSLERHVRVDEGRYVMVEEVILQRLGELFPGMTVTDPAMFRVTRNTDLAVEGSDADDLLAAVEMELRRRRFGIAVRLEVDERMHPEMLGILCEELEMDVSEVYAQRLPLDGSSLTEIHRLRIPGLADEPWPAVVPGRLAAADDTGDSFFSVVRARDLLVHHPYESFAASTEEFIRQAAEDPKVVGIKATLYRTSSDSPIARSLIAAAERGVQVVALIELKARFDEMTNVQWAKALERAGVHVVYGMVGLKTHAKCMLVVRQEDDGLRRYVHVGTGNYNSSTARFYEDMGLFTCDPRITEDISRLFNYLTGYSKAVEYQSLIVAPDRLRPAILGLIARESVKGPAGRIWIKANALADREMVAALAEAAENGAEVRLHVRGICCIDRTRVQSPTMRIRSVLGRYLEHSRIYRFGDPAAPDATYMIGSADLMPRNLDGRVEVLAPVTHPKHRAWIDRILGFMWSDDVVAHELSAEPHAGITGGWARSGPADFVAESDAQARIMEWATSIQIRHGLPSDYDVDEVRGPGPGTTARGPMSTPMVAPVMSWLRDRLGRN
jgi:polyphosphate kinase